MANITINGQVYIIEQGAGGYTYYRVASNQRFGKKVKARGTTLAVLSGTDGTPNPELGISQVEWGVGSILNPSIDPDHIEIIGPSNVDEGTTTQYLCKLIYSNDSYEYVEALWGENSAFASISSDGLLTTGEVSSDESCTIYVEYGNKYAELTITIKDKLVIDYLEITGPESVPEESTAQYVCTAYYTNGTNAVITPTWSVPVGPYSSIDETGLLTTKSVPDGYPPIMSHVIAEYNFYPTYLDIFIYDVS